MISDDTISRLRAAIGNASSYCSGAKRKQLQATYDRLLDELSVNLLGKPCTNRMQFRQRVNNLSDESLLIRSLKEMLKNQELLFRKDYRDHAGEITRFLTNDLAHFLEALDNG
jgi:hypothetical protein